VQASTQERLGALSVNSGERLMTIVNQLLREVRGQMRQSELLHIIGQIERMQKTPLSERDSRAFIDSTKRKPSKARAALLSKK
jgi:hypothetical protein